MSKIKTEPGLPVDSGGNPTVDPTANVIALNEASSRRLDDLSAANTKWVEAKLDHLKEIGNCRSECAKELAELREKHQEALRSAESQRLDSIRQVDREDVNKTAAAAQTAIAALATNTTALADTLRNQVAAVAAAAETRRAADNQEITKRLSALELALSEGKGKQTLADPRMDKLMDVVERLQSGSYRGEGAGNQAAVGKANSQYLGMLIVAVVGIVVAAVAYFVGKN